MSAQPIELEGLLFAPPARCADWETPCATCGGAVAYAWPTPSGKGGNFWYHVHDVEPAYAHPSGERGYWDHRATPAIAPRAT